jgi:L-2,4-diaminobutyrate decarboxylase
VELERTEGRTAPEADRLRILCSKDAHFTVKKSASQLGLGERAVVLVDTDDEKRMSLYDLKRKTTLLEESGLHPFAIVATCGTTDFGSIDPLSVACGCRAWPAGFGFTLMPRMEGR